MCHAETCQEMRYLFILASTNIQKCLLEFGI